jgi:hypothetical protein
LGINKEKFQYAKQKIDENIDIANLLILIHKMKSILVVLVKDNRELIKKAKTELFSSFDLDRRDIALNEAEIFLQAPTNDLYQLAKKSNYISSRVSDKIK